MSTSSKLNARSTAIFAVTLCAFGFLLVSIKPLPQMMFLGFVTLAFVLGKVADEKVGNISFMVEFVLITTFGMAFSCAELAARLATLSQPQGTMQLGPSLLGLIIGIILSAAAWWAVARTYAAVRNARNVLQLAYVLTAALVLVTSRLPSVD